MDANNPVGIAGWLRTVVTVTAIATLISACTSGSGSDNEDSFGGNNSNNGPGYTGPAPLDADVQAFQLNVWNNLVADNRCGNCHKQAGPGPTAFVRDDDINLAYQAALNVVDLNIPAQSRLVERMTEGHQCWDNSNNVCAELMTGYISAWANATSTAATQVTILPPDSLFDPGASLNHPQDPDLFEAEIYNPILSQFCSDCHREDGPVRQQQPYFASTDINIAYDNAKSRISLSNPGSSRFVERMFPDLHNCWDTGSGVNCTQSRDAMLAAINAYIAGLGTPDMVDPGLLISKAMFFPGGDNDPNDAQPATTQGRFETNAIAKYEFQQLDENDDTRVVDLALQSPQLDLTLTGDAEFIPNVGVRFGGNGGTNGKAQGTSANSRKLYNLITLTNEYSIEAWVVPNNVTQDNTRRIISYSGGTTERNFTLGQTLYNYDSLNRTTAATSSQNGATLFSTPDDDEVLQASLQHVVLSFDPINGRRIYVNGELATTDVDDQIGSGLSNWNPDYVLVVGNETSGVDTDWSGTIRMLAIHNRVMSEQQILANFDVGVGQRFYIPFSISHLLPGVNDAYIVFEVERFDAYSYLFNKPFFTVLQSGAQLPSDIQIRGLRIGLNGREAPSGQAYAKIDITITNADYQNSANNWLYLSDVTLNPGDQGLNVEGTIIPVEKTAAGEADEFFLSFDSIAAQSSTITRDLGGPCPDVNSSPCDLVSLATLSYEQSDIGIKNFYEINEMYSRITGVAKNNGNIGAKFNQLRRQLPSREDPVAFATSNQMGIAQYAAAYCEELVSNPTLRGNMWPSVVFSNPLNTQRDEILLPLLEKLTAHGINGGAHLTTQADPADVATDIDTLLAALSTAQPGGNQDTSAAAIAVCTGVLSSAIATVQ